MAARSTPNRVVATLAALSIAAAAVAVGCRVVAGRRGASDEAGVDSIDVGGLTRTYRVYAEQKGAREARALMIVLHGGFGNAERSQRGFGMDAVAAREGFVVAYPDGVGGARPALRNRRTWNAGTCCGAAVRNGVDDVAFLGAMIEKIVREHGVDRSRVYVSGMSNGAMMAYRLACELPDAIAAAIPVAGALEVDSCERGADVAILHIHGTADQNVPIAGGAGPRAVAGVEFRALADTIELLRVGRGCATPTTSQLPDGTELTVHRCQTGAPIHVRLVPGGSHTWPGATVGRQSAGQPTTLSASEAAWEFARQFRK